MDQTSLKIKSKDKRNAWVTDQFLNPHETLHTHIETFNWFEEEGIEFINLIPHVDDINMKMFQKREIPTISKIEELLMILNPRQIQEGGFFIIIGRKN